MQREFGWKPKYKFEEAIKATIQWYRENEQWWRAIKSGDYLKYYQTQYAGR
jgi:dTDP-glucose 4,6-dehydratase